MDIPENDSTIVDHQPWDFDPEYHNDQPTQTNLMQWVMRMAANTVSFRELRKEG